MSHIFYGKIFYAEFVYAKKNILRQKAFSREKRFYSIFLFKKDFFLKSGAFIYAKKLFYARNISTPRTSGKRFLRKNQKLFFLKIRVKKFWLKIMCIYLRQKTFLRQKVVLRQKLFLRQKKFNAKKLVSRHVLRFFVKFSKKILLKKY